jgi:hypothetical protein
MRPALVSIAGSLRAPAKNDIADIGFAGMQACIFGGRRWLADLALLLR